MNAVCELARDVRVFSLVGENTSHVVVRGGRSLLIDCHDPYMDRWLSRRGLPRPDLILHTQVQPEHCREGEAFPEARILVHEALVELASDRAAYERAAHTLWQNPAEWHTVLGREKYSVAGSITVFPPEKPLKLGGTFRDGDRLTWQGLTLEVIPLPGHGREQVGFVLEQAGAPLAVFTGDLLCDRARVVNLYDLETHYGGSTLGALPAVLRGLAERPVERYFPATGPAIPDGPTQARELADAIDAFQQASGWQSGDFTPAPQPDYPRVGRYRQLHRGIYQIDNLGNCILLIDNQGYGLMFDPAPCDYESPSRVAAFHADLDLFERKHGLRTVDLALITHIHGDHYDLAPELKKRYPACRIGALDLVARVIEAPWNYPYAALLPWYNLGFDHVAMDVVLREDDVFLWHDVAIQFLHLPGHCYCHAGYVVEFNGLRLAITGDTIQTRGEAGGLGSIICANHSVPDETSGILKAYRQLAGRGIDLNLGGHGSHFGECEANYTESLRRIEYALPHLRRLVPGGDLDTACVRPGYPRWPRVSLEGADQKERTR
jgi:glyoxylase-like metal-dependent hydrolase (beta-lactamase superfamily II)